MKKFTSFMLVLLLTLISCTTTGSGHYKKTRPIGARPIFPHEIMAGGILMSLALQIISSVDPDINENVVLSLFREMYEDPDYDAYWIPYGNRRMSELSKQSAILNGSLVFGQYALKRTARALKRAARSAAAKEAMEEAQNEEEVELTQEEIDQLKAHANRFSDEEEAELKKCYIYLACSSVALVQTIKTAPDFLSKAIGLVNNPKGIADNAFETIMTIAALTSIVDNISSVIQNAPPLVKNISANIETLRAVLEARKEAKAAEEKGTDDLQDAETVPEEELTDPEKAQKAAEEALEKLDEETAP